MLTTVEKVLPHAQEEEKTAFVVEGRCESARPQPGQPKSRRISDVDKARNTILQQGPTLHQDLRPRTLHQEPRLHEDKMGQKLRAETPAAASLHATSDSNDVTAQRTDNRCTSRCKDMLKTVEQVLPHAEYPCGCTSST